MQKLCLEDIIKATNGELLCGSLDTTIEDICTDSRKVKSGDLFIPIVGENFDGHDFIINSIENGAVASLTSEKSAKLKKGSLIKVKDTTIALGNIAKYYRSKFKIPLVGITGSVGKTSTKDMIASVLDQKFNVLKTSGNFNNQIGLPITMMNLDSSHEAAVIEMGMSGPGEIKYLSEIAKPHIAVITNIGLAHIEKLGSKQNILKAKTEILEGLSKDGLVVLNGDDSLLYGLKGLLPFKTVFFGTEEGMDYQAYNIKTMAENGSVFEISIHNNEYNLRIPTPGVHNVYNALAAIAVGTELGMNMEEIIEGISNFSPGKMRLNIISQNGVKIISDAYNASPKSMEAGIDVLADIGSTGGRTIAVLGDMLEMGEWAYDAHLGVGSYVHEKGISMLVTVGENGKHIGEGAIKAGTSKENVISFDNNIKAVNFLKEFLKEGDTVLVKGSRGMKMEEIVDKITIIP